MAQKPPQQIKQDMEKTFTLKSVKSVARKAQLVGSPPTVSWQAQLEEKEDKSVVEDERRKKRMMTMITKIDE